MRQVEGTAQVVGIAQGQGDLQISRFTAGSSAAGGTAGDVGLKGAGEYAAILAHVVQSETFPALGRALHAGGFGAGEAHVEDEDFRFGLDLLLDGVETLIARRT